MAHVVSKTGRVTAIELDVSLAAKAAENLRELKHVKVISTDTNMSLRPR
jgi:protein-L-isoaspartate O-methyltransferase